MRKIKRIYQKEIQVYSQISINWFRLLHWNSIRWLSKNFKIIISKTITHLYLEPRTQKQLNNITMKPLNADTTVGIPTVVSGLLNYELLNY